MLTWDLIAGDTLEYTTSVPDYPASAGWTLTYRLIPRTSGASITFSASPNGRDYRVQVGADATASWAPGAYSWVSYVVKPGERHTVDSGQLTIRANPGTVTAYDGRTHAAIMLERIEAAIQALNLGTKSYTIGSRSMTKRDLPELMAMRTRYQREVNDETARDLGLPAGPLGRIRYGVPH